MNKSGIKRLFNLEINNQKLTYMKTLKFKTNIKCGGCVAAVAPHLDELTGENNWSVDLADERRVLTVSADVSAKEIEEALTKAGYKGEKIES